MDSNIDLDINNYKLIDILNLFKLNYNFSKCELKNTKRMVLKTHPDKSNLDQKYFLFFIKAFKILLQIYEFREHKEHNEHKVKDKTYDKTYLHSKENEDLLENFKSNPNFNQMFNELFEKHNLNTLSKSDGYGDWLKSDQDINTDNVSKNNMNEYIENKKRELSAIQPVNNIKELSNNTFSNLFGHDEHENFASDVFSSLPYEDLKKAHVESLIPVTIEDSQDKISRNLENIKYERSSQNVNPFTEMKSREILEKNRENEDKDDIQRLYEYAKEEENLRKVNDNLMATFKRLT